ncbi:MAG: flagellar biosynthetic protein FliO [Ruminococcaceae bacterium]|jgi:flagellar protein FliO/FliZ|nr:flagellar biosynthetic protein FliO [Oscillospiraceae bacterium]
MDNVWSLLGVLAVVVLILYLAYAASKWIGTHGVPGGAPAVRPGGAGQFRILGQLPVGRNERLVLFRLDERCYLLGVTEHQITLLRELDGEEAAKWLAESEGAPAPGFAEVLGSALRKKK